MISIFKTSRRNLYSAGGMLSIHPSNSTRVDSVPGRVNSLLVKMNGVVRMCIKLLFSTENLETKNR